MASIMTSDFLALTLPQAVQALHSGHIIAYPTEAVWGIGCDARQSKAVHFLLAAKQRSVEKGLIILVDQLDRIHHWLDWQRLTPERTHDILTSWPGPYTWVLPCTQHAPVWLTGRHSAIAVRISAHPLVAQLCCHWQAPLVSTSANRTGQSPVTHRHAIDPVIQQHCIGYLPGQTQTHARPTQIRDAQTGQILRE